MDSKFNTAANLHSFSSSKNDQNDNSYEQPARVFPRCPHCPLFLISIDEDGKQKKETLHAASNLKILECFQIGDDFPLEYELDGISHQHDFNKIVITWQCRDGHTFQTEKNKINDCIGCVLAEHKAIRNEKH